MTVSLKELESKLLQLLKPEQFSDYCPNGLQVQGRSQIQKIVTGVTACQALIDAAALQNADAILVHHGYFWRGEDQSITGLKKVRIGKLLEHDINLLAYHLPLDVHSELGNNVQLAKLLEIDIEGDIYKQNNHGLVLEGRLNQTRSFEEFSDFVSGRLNRPCFAVQGGSEEINSIAWCTGAAQNYIEMAVDAGVDAYLTGEVSEQTVHIAREAGIHFFAAGHHATERYGVQAVGNYLADEYKIEHQFIDIDNPI
ncbi:MAG TPA: Nif3-like dinuclear metal center hexameric protein [Porticoccaceae bacterium]|jgi:dinuclear metal center YbgI/SA1388 family protein|nr:Nif3-like dinuclear metal center hexameric protein [Gammaproteobacteria bacterium]HIL59156.1 Nif3-like dinuclear metal center hexameric protein [Porticoccaceae bacterium]